MSEISTLNNAQGSAPPQAEPQNADSATADKARYALNKQVPTMHTIQSNYGDIEIDDALMAKIKPVLEHYFKALIES